MTNALDYVYAHNIHIALTVGCIQNNFNSEQNSRSSLTMKTFRSLMGYTPQLYQNYL